MRKIGKYKWGSEGEAKELAGGFDDVVGVVVAQLGDGTETPADSCRLDAGAAGGIHVDARIADIKHLGFRGGALAEGRVLRERPLSAPRLPPRVSRGSSG